LTERLSAALDRLEALVADRDALRASHAALEGEVMRLRHIEREARIALGEIDALLREDG
jgi:hypothetical protein